MNKDMFLHKLEELLSDLPEAEKSEALEYYRNYFEDAGDENSEKVIEELGSPEHISEIIHRDLSKGRSPDHESFTHAASSEGKKPLNKKLISGLFIGAGALALIAAAYFISGPGRTKLFGPEGIFGPSSGEGIQSEGPAEPGNTPAESPSSDDDPDGAPADDKIKPEPKKDGPAAEKQKPEPKKEDPAADKPTPKADGANDGPADKLKEGPAPDKPAPEPKAGGPKDGPAAEKPKPEPKADGPEEGLASDKPKAGPAAIK